MIELLVSTGILLAVMTVILSLVVPIFRRSGTIDERQADIQESILFREYAFRALRNGNVIKLTPSSVQYRRARTVDTAHGEFREVTPSGQIIWDDSAIWEITTIVQNGQVVIVDRPLDSGPDHPLRRTLANLGPAEPEEVLQPSDPEAPRIPSLTFSGTLPIIEVSLLGVTGSADKRAVWNRTFRLVAESHTRVSGED